MRLLLQGSRLARKLRRWATVSFRALPNRTIATHDGGPPCPVHACATRVHPPRSVAFGRPCNGVSVQNGSGLRLGRTVFFSAGRLGSRSTVLVRRKESRLPRQIPAEAKRITTPARQLPNYETGRVAQAAISKHKYCPSCTRRSPCSVIKGTQAQLHSVEDRVENRFQPARLP